MQNIVISFKNVDGWDSYSVLQDIVDQTNTNINALDASVYVSIFDTSLGNLSTWNINQDNSIINIKSYIDGSLLIRDNSISYIFLNKANNIAPDFTTSINWSGGNVIYVPLSGNIQTYINNASSGDTIILSSGVYNITSSILINKQINIIGQGNSGFVTFPITPSHGTLISSSTLGITAFQINSDNVRISELSINLTGAASTAINTINNLQGIVLSTIDVIVNCAGLAQGFTIYGSDAVLRDLTFYITSTNNGSSGLWIWNDNTTTKNSIVDCFNVTGTVIGGSTYAYAFVCENIDSIYTLTLNLSNSVCRSLAGTPLDVAVASISSTTNNSIVNAYFCTLDGNNYDAYQNGNNQLNLGASVVANNLIYGTVTYRAAMVSGITQSPIINGGINANDDIIIQGTNNATKTTSYVNLQPTGGNVGIGTIAPNSTLHLIGSISTPPTLVSSDVSLNINHNKIIVSAAATITLPTANGILGRQYNIIRSGTGNVIINPIISQTINGDPSLTLTNQWDRITLISDNSNWIQCS